MRNKKLLVLLKRPGESFETVYFDFSAENMLEYFGVDSLDKIVSMSCLLCKGASVFHTYSSNLNNCKVFNYVFDGALMFVGEKPNGTYCNISTRDIENIKRCTVDYVTPPKTKKKRLSWSREFIWEV